MKEELKRKRKSVKKTEDSDATSQSVEEHQALIDQLDTLSEEELTALKKKLAEMEK